MKEKNYLNRKEYNAILDMAGSLNYLLENQSLLGGILDSETKKQYDKTVEVLQGIFEKILKATPQSIHPRLREEIKGMKIKTEQQGRGMLQLPQTKTLYGFFPWIPIMQLVNHLLNSECYMCEKKGKEIGECPYKKAI